MIHRIARHILSGMVALLLTLVSTPAWAEAGSWTPPPQWFVYVVIAIVLVGALLALAFIRAALSLSTWSLADALSEETEVTAMITNAAGQPEPKLDAAGKPLMITEMRASASQLIALMGMMVILLRFLGFGRYVQRPGPMPRHRG